VGGLHPRLDFRRYTVAPRQVAGMRNDRETPR